MVTQVAGAVTQVPAAKEVVVVVLAPPHLLEKEAVLGKVVVVLRHERVQCTQTPGSTDLARSMAVQVPLTDQVNVPRHLAIHSF